MQLLAFIRLFFMSRAALVAENLFLRRQLALFRERKVKPRQTTPVYRLAMVALARFFNWRDALVIVKPETFLKWHRAGFRVFWRWKSRRPGRPPLPKNLKELIGAMARDNRTWGEERIANELSLKLGIHVAPRTVRKYLKSRKPPDCSGERWSTFVRNHAAAIVACDFCVSITATFQILYVFVAMEIGSRRIVHFNVTDHPTAEWTIQQFREILADPHPYRIVVHDRDSIFSSPLDDALKDFGVRPIKTPVRAPKANAYCERLIGTIRRECLDYLIPINNRHLRLILREFIGHYNRGRPHSALGPGIPDLLQSNNIPGSGHRHKLPTGHRVTKDSVLAGLHHNYRLEKEAA
jgi:putative transposase